MAFRVYKNGVPADNHHWGGGEDRPWGNESLFPIKREAEIYVFMWAYSLSRKDAEKRAGSLPLNKEVDCSPFGGEYGLVMMKIEEEVDKEGQFNDFGMKPHETDIYIVPFENDKTDIAEEVRKHYNTVVMAGFKNELDALLHRAYYAGRCKEITLF